MFPDIKETFANAYYLFLVTYNSENFALSYIDYRQTKEESQKPISFLN